MRLRTKYVVVLCAVLLVLGTVVVVTAELFKTQTIEREQADLKRQTEIAAQQVDSAVVEQGDLLERYAGTINVSDTAQSRRTVGQLVNNTNFVWVATVDGNGTVVDMQGAIEESRRQAVLGRPVDETTLTGDKGSTDTIERGPRTFTDPEPIAWGDQQSYLLNITVPISDRDRITGALVGAVVLQETDFFGAVAPLETETETARIVAPTADGQQSTLVESESSFSESIWSTAQVETTGWILEVQQDRSELTQQLQFLQFTQFGSLFAVLLSVLGLGVYQYRTTLRQTDELLTGFDELTDGNFEYGLDLAAAEEWTQISDGFNTMADGLREREAQIREREQQIRERERRLSVLNRVLRHNLQNDMSVIQGFAQVVPEADSQERLEELSERIIDKSRKLVDHGQKARSLEEIMENAEDGPVEMDLVRELEQIVSDYRSAYPDATIEVDTPEAAWGLAVPRAEAGIESLVENACEHNDSDEPAVHITVESDAQTVAISVGDNGPGIPEYERAVLTQDEETSLEHGSGIGLWLAYWAAVKSGGDLEFDDTDDGGAVVTISFPACDPPENKEQIEQMLSV
jgi:signal transduction histidine kinase